VAALVDDLAPWNRKTDPDAGSADALCRASGVDAGLLRRLVLKEIFGDNACDAADAAERYGAVSVERDPSNPDRYIVTDQGTGILGTPEEIASLFSIGREMVSRKFWRLPKRGCLGNGLRLFCGAVAATGGRIEVSTGGHRLLLHPRKDGRTQILESNQIDPQPGTRIAVTFGPDLPRDGNDLDWANETIELARRSRPAYTGLPSPHWFDADCLAEVLSTVEPATTTVRQFVEQFAGCSGAKAGKIAAAFGKGRLCRDLTEQDAFQLLAMMQDATRLINPSALIPLGPDAFNDSLVIGGERLSYDGYACKRGTFEFGAHKPQATIPFVVEAWAMVKDRKSRYSVDVPAMANRSPVPSKLSLTRWGDDNELACRGLNLDGNSVTLLPGICYLKLHVTSPFLPLLSTGDKRPDFAWFKTQITETIRLAFNRSRNLLPEDPKEPKEPKPPPPEKPPPKPAHIPTTALGLRIATEAEEHCVSLDELTVLSSDPYRFDHETSLRNGQWFAGALDTWAPKLIHIRGIFYLLTSSGIVYRPDTGKLLVNREEDWQWLKDNAYKAARWNGLIAFDRLVDERSEPLEDYTQPHAESEPLSLSVTTTNDTEASLRFHPHSR
jgi:hypothetical protein